MSETDDASVLRPLVRASRWSVDALVMTAAVLGAVVLVLMVAVLVSWPPLLDFDSSTNVTQLAWSASHPWALAPARLLSVAGQAWVVVPVVGGAAWVQWRRGRSLLSWWLLATVAAGWATTHLLKTVVQRDRPASNGTYWLANDPSFPSGHASVAVYGYGALAILAWWTLSRGRRGWVATVLGLLACGIGTSRLVLTVHWTSDVVAGYLTGATVLLLTTAWVVARAPRAVSEWSGAQRSSAVDS
ncbi:MAG: phosphatase PAP2 family protein [Actinomycetes bacterium]